MPSSEAELIHARECAERARGQLTIDLIALKRWLMPRRLLGRFVQAAKDSGARALTAGTDAVEARPGIAIGALALGALFLARKPIGRALSSKRARPSRKSSGSSETTRPSARSAVQRSPSTPARPRKAKS